MDWLAGGLDEDRRHDFDGAIVFDEAHAMANAAGSTGSRGKTAPSQQGRAGLRPPARAPGRPRPLRLRNRRHHRPRPRLRPAPRPLGRRGDPLREPRRVRHRHGGRRRRRDGSGRPRPQGPPGLYQARALAYEGVEVDILEHELTPEQRRIYDAYANAFKVIHANIGDALKATGIVEGKETLNRNAKAAALSAFESTKQRFFGHLLTAMKCPALFRAIDADLEEGRACVVQLVSTGEALMERRIADIPASEWNDLSIDLTPREYVLHYLAHAAFPVQLQEPFTDADGNLMSRPVTGNRRQPGALPGGRRRPRRP